MIGYTSALWIGDGFETISLGYDYSSSYQNNELDNVRLPILKAAVY